MGYDGISDEVEYNISSKSLWIDKSGKYDHNSLMEGVEQKTTLDFG